MTRRNPIRGTVAILLAALAPWAMALTGNAGLGTEDSTIPEAGTIPDGPPGLPVLPDQRGPQGPIAAEQRPTTDPSIRPFLSGPDIRNGLWETLGGNRVVRPRANPGTGGQPS